MGYLCPLLTTTKLGHTWDGMFELDGDIYFMVGPKGDEGEGDILKLAEFQAEANVSAHGCGVAEDLLWWHCHPSS